MNCFVLFSQIVVTVFNQYSWNHGFMEPELDTTSRAVFKAILTGYGFWNLDFFRYFIPPFCVSQGLKNIHVLALQYVSAFYPLLLIALTYACVELHGNNFRPILLSGYGNHFIDVVLMSEIGGMQKRSLSMSSPHSLFCLTVSFCLCQLSIEGDKLVQC